MFCVPEGWFKTLIECCLWPSFLTCVLCSWVMFFFSFHRHMLHEFGLCGSICFTKAWALFIGFFLVLLSFFLFVAFLYFHIFVYVFCVHLVLVIYKIILIKYENYSWKNLLTFHTNSSFNGLKFFVGRRFYSGDNLEEHGFNHFGGIFIQHIPHFV